MDFRSFFNKRQNIEFFDKRIYFNDEELAVIKKYYNVNYSALKGLSVTVFTS